MWKNFVETDRPYMTIWLMRIACRIPKATNTHSEYVLLNVFHCNSGYPKAPQCYVIRTLLVLLKVSFQTHKRTRTCLCCFLIVKFQSCTCLALKGCVNLYLFLALLLWASIWHPVIAWLVFDLRVHGAAPSIFKSGYVPCRPVGRVK
jgi:hypothetical protein